MKKGLKTMLVVSSCMLAMSTNVCAAEPVDGQIIDGSMLTHETQSTVSEIFDWNFESMDEIAPFGSAAIKSNNAAASVNPVTQP